MITIQLLLSAPLLAYACWRDLSARMIPDAISVALGSIGLITSLAAGWETAWPSLLTAILLFTVLLGCAMRGWLGGGDVKLAGAMALGMAPATTLIFVYATSLAGGLLALVYLAGPLYAPRAALVPHAGLLSRLVTIEARRLRRRGPLPYGFAIAAGALVALLSVPS